MNNSGSDFERWIQSLQQDPQHVACAAARAGERVVGYVGDDAPVALVLAAGALAVRLHGKPDAPTPRVDAFIESSFTPELRIIANQWLEGSLDHLDAAIFTRGDDSAQRLYYYMCELQRRGQCAGPRPLLYDVASLERRSSLEHTLESTRLLAEQLGAPAGKLEQALGRVARREELLQTLWVRRARPAPLRGSTAWSVAFAAGCDWREDFDGRARHWLDRAPMMLPMPKRVVLAGDPLPDNQLHLALEACGASVVLELTSASSTGVRVRREPLTTIAAEFQRRESPAVSMRRNGRWLADCALEERADAVVVWLSEQNEALPWEVSRQMQSLRNAGVPALLLARQPWRVSASLLAAVVDFVRNPGIAK